MLGVLAIGLALTSCSSDDSLPNSQTAAEKGTTYASLSISFPTSSGTRASSGLPNDYNPVGTWSGRDEIKSITVFLYNTTLGTIDYTTFGTSQFNGISNDGVLTPNLAVKATPGQNVKAYVVVNDVHDKVTTTLINAATKPNTFDAAFASEVSTIANQVSAYNSTDTKDIIMMTNDVTPTTVAIQPDITEQQAKDGTTNLISVKVQRVVSRAIVTMAKDINKNIQLYDASGKKASTITISDVKYGVGQSGQSFFNLQKTDYLTPSAIYSGDATLGATLMDNTGLNSFSEVTSIAGNTNESIAGALSSETSEKFVLPVTHSSTGYYKGNTTYFEIRATFTPDSVKDVENGTYKAGDDVYLGQNDGLFYSTRALAEANGQKSTCYKGDGSKGAITKYVLWLNPDAVPGTVEQDGDKKASMSPTVRNQVYNVYISGFKTIGVPNNPLNPGSPDDPTKPVGPDNPINPKNPNNPADPNIPDNPDNPIKPTDPLETNDTYLSVTITVLPYTIHSYGIDMGNDY
ncbi:Mfa1 family fimbria major subunit [Prevotella cerevisiae]|uniref:Mfa1 family fimbria major subunit n=2 Tax=Segatella cerevisiae TaxID=2053716 RepID=A0ABT1BW30_9BACT|nr:Mfa1 family fimbria major subunit [Segatella cerevisiae]